MVTRLEPELSLPPAPVERSHPFRDWAARQGLRLFKARAAREARAFDGDPRLSVRWPWRRETPRGNQTLRAFIQINVLPRPR